MTVQKEVRKTFQDQMSLGIGTTPHHVDMSVVTVSATATWTIRFYDYNFQLIQEPVSFAAWAITALDTFQPDIGDLSYFSAGSSSNVLLTTDHSFYREFITCANGTGTVVEKDGSGSDFGLAVWPEGCDRVFRSTELTTIE